MFDLLKLSAFIITYFSYFLEKNTIFVFLPSLFIYIKRLYEKRDFNFERELSIIFMTSVVTFMDRFSDKKEWITKTNYFLSYIVFALLKKFKIDAFVKFGMSFGTFLIFFLALANSTNVDNKIIYLGIDLLIKNLIQTFNQLYKSPNEFVLLSFSISSLFINNIFCTQCYSDTLKEIVIHLPFIFLVRNLTNTIDDMSGNKYKKIFLSSLLFIFSYILLN